MPLNITAQKIKVSIAISIIPIDKLRIDNTIVAVLIFFILFVVNIPIIPTGIPAKSIITLPITPISSNNFNGKLEFKTFVEVTLQQIINGTSTANINSNQKIIVLVSSVFFVTSEYLLFIIIYIFANPNQLN